MCGIAGFVDRSGRHASLTTELDLAVAALRHRGPNDQGTWLEEHARAGLGQTRLSVLDLSSNGHQPMISADGQLIMAFNGEVYNFAAIRAELEPLGHHFRGTGDSEVILAALQQWGMAAVDRFIGMFAIALWDRRAQRLVLLRDRLGVKPLYFGWDGEVLCFGSELKALRRFSHWSPEIDRDALAEYFQFGYIDAPRSIYRGVSKLMPGHWLELGPQGEPVLHRYWSVLDALATPLQGSDDELLAQLEDLLKNAFQLRMVSDVPLGVFLSGGVDSSLVTALLQRSQPERPLHTYTIGFDEPQFDESQHAARVAAHCGTRHTSYTLNPDSAKAVVAQWAEFYDEPFFDSSGIPTYLVTQLAARDVTVVLSADGGDELFSGYNSYTGMLDKMARRARWPVALRRVFGRLLRGLPLTQADRWLDWLPLPQGARVALRQRLLLPAQRLRRGLNTPGAAGLYEQAVTIWQPEQIARLTGSYRPVRDSLDDYPGSLVDKMSLWDLHHYLPGDILAKVDRATMRESIEGREPLLDHRVVEFALRLPEHLRRGSLGSKHALREILYRYVPRTMIERPKKGFSIPLADWLRGDLGHLIDTHLAPATVARQGVLDGDMVAEAVLRFRQGDDNYTQFVWSLLAFQMWYQKWVA